MVGGGAIIESSRDQDIRIEESYRLYFEPFASCFFSKGTNILDGAALLSSRSFLSKFR